MIPLTPQNVLPDGKHLCLKQYYWSTTIWLANIDIFGNGSGAVLKSRFEYFVNLLHSVFYRLASVEPHQCEEGTEECDGAKGSDVDVHVIVLLVGEQWVVALDPTALHVLVPAVLVVRFHQRCLAVARCVELYLLHLCLSRQVCL